MKSSLSIKSLLLVLLPFAFFMNACKKGPGDISPSLTDVCLIAKQTKFDLQGKIINESTYTYNSKGQVSSLKYYTTQSSSPVTDTESYQYNSDGQVIKTTSSNTTTNYIYDNKILIEKNGNKGKIIYSIKYFYNADLKKSKQIYKSTIDNEVSLNYEEIYFYQDTLLIRSMYRNLMPNSPVSGFDYVYKYDSQNILIEKQTLRQNNSVYETEKYQYGIDRNVIKMTQFNANNDKENEEIYTYANNKLVEKIIFSFYSTALPPSSYKTVFEYNQDNLSKITYFFNGELIAHEQYVYTCDK